MVPGASGWFRSEKLDDADVADDDCDAIVVNIDVTSKS